MELEGKISVVMPANSGVSQRTGNAWMSQEYVMQYYWFPNQTQPSYIVMRAFGEGRIKQFNLQPNDEVKVRFHAEAHESNGRWYNEIRIDGVTFIGASANKNHQPTAEAAGTGTKQTAEGAGTGTKQTAEGAVTEAAPQQQENEAGGESDDLPF